MLYHKLIRAIATMQVLNRRSHEAHPCVSKCRNKEIKKKKKKREKRKEIVKAPCYVDIQKINHQYAPAQGHCASNLKILPNGMVTIKAKRTRNIGTASKT